MPELPDIIVYLDALKPRISGANAGARASGESVSVCAPWNRRLAKPRGVRCRFSRLGKRLVIALEGELFLVLHLMIAGRLHWKGAAQARGQDRFGCVRFSDRHPAPHGGRQQARASLHLVRGETELAGTTPAVSKCSTPI